MYICNVVPLQIYKDLQMAQKELEGFFQLCKELKTSKQWEEFFGFFLTREELEMLHGRFQIVQALLEGELTQREIAKKYKVSIAQITRGSNALKTISPKLKAFLTRKRTENAS